MYLCCIVFCVQQVPNVFFIQIFDPFRPTRSISRFGSFFIRSMQSIRGFSGFVVFSWIHFYSLMKKFYSLTADGMHQIEMLIVKERQSQLMASGHNAKHSFEPYAHSISGRTKIPISKLKNSFKWTKRKKKSSGLLLEFLMRLLNIQWATSFDERRKKTTTRYQIYVWCCT